MGWHMDEWSWAGWFVMAVAMAAFWLALAWVLVLALRGRPTGGAATAEDVLAHRYAAGEIDDDEYERRLDVLRHRS